MDLLSAHLDRKSAKNSKILPISPISLFSLFWALLWALLWALFRALLWALYGGVRLKVVCAKGAGKIHFGDAAGTHMVQLATKRLGTYNHKSTMHASWFANVYMVHHACFMFQGFKSTRFIVVPFQKKKQFFKVRL